MYYKTATFFSLLLQTTLQQDPTFIIQLSNGPIIGRWDSTYSGTPYYAFEKIPYAAPPVGDLRFKPPQPPQNWTNTLNTTHLDVVCPQIGGFTSPDVTETEDCLYLSLFTPRIPYGNAAPVPVMVYIHGGGFMSGSAYDFSKPDLFIDSEVLLVVINYRLGPFGFISTQDEVIPGNNGLKDQHLALQWIHENIDIFGGVSNKVTIFGQSAGGGSCAYHLLNPNSFNLFQGAILESGTFLSPGMYQRDSRNIAFGTAAVLDSRFETERDSNALLELLLNSSVEDIKQAAETYQNSVSQPYVRLVDQGSMWAPVIEVDNPEAFITEKMYKLLSIGNILPIPTMMGFTSEESILGNEDENIVRNNAEIIDCSLDVIVPNDMQIDDQDNRIKEGELIREIYTGGEPFIENLGALIRYSSDNTLTRAMIKHAELFSPIANTFFYQFSYDGEVLGGLDIHYDGAGTVGHTEELNYLFCQGSDCNDENKYPAQDLLTRQRLIKIWTNFAKYQNPTPEMEDLLQNITWPQLSVENGDFLYLDINTDLKVMNHPKKEYYDGWIQLYDTLGFTDFDTY